MIKNKSRMLVFPTSVTKSPISTFLITETKCVKEEEFVLDHSSEKYSPW